MTNWQEASCPHCGKPISSKEALFPKGAMTSTYSKLYDCKGPNDSGWQDRHRAACAYHGPAKPNHELAIRHFLIGWAAYRDAHRRRFESGIGDDQILGPAWIQIGTALRTLLNGETGHFDCGTVDGWILDTLRKEGFEEE